MNDGHVLLLPVLPKLPRRCATFALISLSLLSLALLTVAGLASAIAALWSAAACWVLILVLAVRRLYNRRRQRPQRRVPSAFYPCSRLIVSRRRSSCLGTLSSAWRVLWSGVPGEPWVLLPGAAGGQGTYITWQPPPVHRPAWRTVYAHFARGARPRYAPRPGGQGRNGNDYQTAYVSVWHQPPLGSSDAVIRDDTMFPARSAPESDFRREYGS